MPARAVAVALVVVLVATACGSEPAPVTEADYLDGLQAICADTAATIDALPQPPEQISVADFAASAAGALDNEAERVRALRVPDELVADHRGFIRNTDEQATAWRAIAAAGQDSSQLDQSIVRVGELIRGRNDLVDEMGAPGCRRGEV